MKRLSTLWIGLGAVAIGFSLLSFLLTVIFGPFLENAWTWGNLAVGVLLLAVGLITNRELLGALLHSEGAMGLVPSKYHYNRVPGSSDYSAKKH